MTLELDIAEGAPGWSLYVSDGDIVIPGAEAVVWLHGDKNGQPCLEMHATNEDCSLSVTFCQTPLALALSDVINRTDDHAALRSVLVAAIAEIDAVP